ncbi:MAG: hypothetical protein N3D11_02105 [Candidatus Sumerlaeia bacterium]|nr:hypothetical protein [Candidatus Sumerlaeia bacterium]
MVQQRLWLKCLLPLILIAFPSAAQDLKVIREFPLDTPNPALKLGKTYRVTFGDVDGDGEMEIVLNNGTMMTCVYKLNGTKLWEIYNPSGQRHWDPWHPWIAPVWDLNNDGKDEVVTYIKDKQDGKNYIAIVEGPTGRILKKAPFSYTGNEPKRMIVAYTRSKTSPSIYFTYLGNPKELSEYDVNLNLVQVIPLPVNANGKSVNGHHISAIDITGDGLHELFTGRAILNSDGSLFWMIPYPNLNWDHVDENIVLDLDPDLPGLEVISYGGSGMMVTNLRQRKILWTNNYNLQHVVVGQFDANISGPLIMGATKNDGQGRKQFFIFDPKGKIVRQWEGQRPGPTTIIDLDGRRSVDDILAGNRVVLNPQFEVVIPETWPFTQPQDAVLEWHPYAAVYDILGDSREELIALREEKLVIAHDVSPADSLGPSVRFDRLYRFRNANASQNRIYFKFPAANEKEIAADKNKTF